MRRLWPLFFSLLLFLSVGLPARAYSNPGQPAGFVNDFAGIFKAEEKNALEAKLSQFSASSSNEVSVVTIKSLNGDTIENYAVKLFADWKIGQAKKDNGVLLLIALNDRKMRIEVGYGLEGALPDATCNQIITKTLRPAFQSSDYYGGVNQAVDQIIAATKGEYQAEPAASDDFGSGKVSLDLIFGILIFLFYTILALWRFLAKSRSWWQGGVIGGVLGLVISLIFFRTFLLLILIPVFLGGFGLLSDYLVSRVLPKPRPRGKGGRDIFWFLGGGPGGFGGGSGGGFGGFGGGSSGGGGASGSW